MENAQQEHPGCSRENKTIQASENQWNMTSQFIELHKLEFWCGYQRFKLKCRIEDCQLPNDTLGFYFTRR